LSLPNPYYNESGITIYHGDCKEILPHLEPVDLVLTDPPYGIGYKATNPGHTDFGTIYGDESEPNLDFLFALPYPKVVFGAINFPKQLPHKGRWICWDKRVNPKADAVFGSPFELAWQDVTSGYDKIIRLMHGGFVNQDGRETKRVHPTQKPTGVMRKIMEWYPKR